MIDMPAFIIHTCTESPGQASIGPYMPIHDIFVLVELALRHLRYRAPVKLII